MWLRLFCEVGRLYFFSFIYRRIHQFHFELGAAILKEFISGLTYLYIKPQSLSFESTNKLGSICTLREKISNLPNMLLFQFWWPWQFPVDATPNFTCDSNFLMFRLSHDTSFIPVSYLQHGQNSQNVNLVTRACKYLFLPVYFIN